MRFAFRIVSQSLVVLSLAMQATMVSANIDSLLRAQELLNHGQSGSALAILLAIEPELAGDTRFDYLFGLALFEEGETGKAIFALRRAVENNPDFAAARLDLARAYFSEQRFSDARSQLLVLRDQNPPPTAQKEIRNLLDQIDSRLEPGKNKYEAYLQLAGGFDGNANAATDTSRFLGFILDPESRETDSPYGSLSLGAQVQRPMNSGLVWRSRADLGQKNYPDAPFVNTTLGSLRSSVRKVKDQISYSGGVMAYRLNTDDKLNSQGVSIDGDYERALSQQTYWRVFGKLSAIRYADEQDVRDVNQYLVGSSASRVFGISNNGNLGATLLLGMDDARLAASKYNRNIYGLQLFVAWNFNNNVRIQTVAGGSQSDYDDVFFPQQVNEKRRDTLAQVTLSLTWKINRDWLFNYSYSQMKNNSNVDIFSFDRNVTGFSFRRIWR
jgi:tetratricopeptide (TPR) repeat protein